MATIRPAPHKARNLYYGLSLNLSRLLDDTLFKHGGNTRAQTVTHTVLEFVQPPGTTALVEHGL